MARYVYSFGAGKAMGRASMREVLGGKGAGLHEMTRMGVPVPPGFTISTAVCTHFYEHRGQYPEGLKRDVAGAMRRVEKIMGRRFGDGDDPLLVSVRSGARESMPGMMDTVLNLGLNDRTVAGMIRRSGNPRFVYDSYRRFVQMYGDVVLGMKPDKADQHDVFETLLERKKRARGVADDTGLAAEDLQDLVGQFKDEIRRASGAPFPEGPGGAALGRHRRGVRVVEQRPGRGLPGNVRHPRQLGHRRQRPDHGVRQHGARPPAPGWPSRATRPPESGVSTARFLMNAQGEDVVAGIRTPQPISELARVQRKAYRELQRIAGVLEAHYRDMQDPGVHHRGRPALAAADAQPASAPASPRCASPWTWRTAGVIAREEALQRIEPEHLSQVLRPVFDQAAKDKAQAAGKVLGLGTAGGPGRGHRTDRVPRRRRGSAARPRRERDPVPGGDQSRGHPRHRGGPGHPHGARRHDFPRRAGGAAARHGVRGGLRRPGGGLPRRAKPASTASCSGKGTGCRWTAAPAR